MVPEITEAQKKEWRVREALRLRVGTYTELPDSWQNAHWFADQNGTTYSHHRLGRTYNPRYPDHFAHISVDKVAMIAFTENDQKGVRDRQTRISPGRYLTKYFSEVLTKNDIQALATEMGAAYDEQDVELLFAKTADEIEMVYKSGPSSCMDGEHTFDSDEHPTRVYAGYDLAVAYLQRQERITARVLVWPEKKFYGRIYGDTIRMRTAMGGAGYKYSENFHGARITKLMECGAYVIPYLDGEVCGAIDRGDHLELSDGSNTDRAQRLCCAGDRQNGLSEDGGTSCEECGDRVSEDDAQGDGDYSYCPNCYSSQYGYCERNECDVPRHELETVRIRRRTSWLTQQWGRNARDDYTFYCDFDGVYYADDNNEAYDVGHDTWGPAAFERNGVTIDGVHYDKRNLPDGVVLPPEAPEIVVGCLVTAVEGTGNITIGNVYRVTHVFMRGEQPRISIEANDAGRPVGWRKDAFRFHSPAPTEQRGLHIRHEPNTSFPYKLFHDDVYIDGYSHRSMEDAHEHMRALRRDPARLAGTIVAMRNHPLHYVQPALTEEVA